MDLHGGSLRKAAANFTAGLRSLTYRSATKLRNGHGFSTRFFADLRSSRLLNDRKLRKEQDFNADSILNLRAPKLMRRCDALVPPHCVVARYGRDLNLFVMPEPQHLHAEQAINYAPNKDDVSVLGKS